MVNIAHVKAHHRISHNGDCPFCEGWPIDFDAIDGLKLLHAVVCQLLLMLLDGLKAKGRDILDGLSQSVGSYIVGRARLELKRQALKGGFLPSYLVDHLASALIGRQFLQPFLLAIEYTDARWSVHLMAAKGKEIAIHRLYIYLKMRGALCTIHQNGDAMLVGCLDNLLYRIHRAQHITYMRHADQLCFS